MLIQTLFQSPALLIVWLSVIIVAITVHEFSHAYVGYLKGDHTAEAEGRLTLNPLAHIDPFGFLMLLIFGFGWAKPVPYNPYNLKNPLKDAVHIALAGPFSNLVLAVISGLLLRLLLAFDLLPATSLLLIFLSLMTLVNLFLLFFNIIPVHPLDGSKIVDAVLVKPHQQKLRHAIMHYGPRVLLVLVLISVFTNINIFVFISIPAFFVYALLVGPEALTLLL